MPAKFGREFRAKRASYVAGVVSALHGSYIDAARYQHATAGPWAFNHNPQRFDFKTLLTKQGF